MILSAASALVPVLLFLAVLRWVDSYKLTPPRRIATSISFGMLAAAASYFANTILDAHPVFAVPIIEQLAKAPYWVWLIVTARVAFMVDSGICAFGVGAGFALVENILYLQNAETGTLSVSLLRGFGTAFMHGGVDAIAAMVSVYLTERYQSAPLKSFPPGILAAIALHMAFNAGWLPPLYSALAMLILMPLFIIAVFLWGESRFHHWLGDKLDEDIDLLAQMYSADLSSTRAGAYLGSLQRTFAPEILGDMLCLLHLTTELSIYAKGQLLLREAGLEPEPNPFIEDKFEELRFLENSIGPTGLRAIAPLLAQSPRDLWQFHQLQTPSA